MDEEEASITCGAFFFDAQQGHWFMIPGYRDKGCGANVAFADGHVSFRKWDWLSRTRTGTSTGTQNAQDRADLAWVVSAALP